MQEPTERVPSLDRASEVLNVSSNVRAPDGPELIVEALSRHAEYPRARSTLKIAAKRVGMDWPEVIWDMWLSFEHHHGSIEQVNTALMQISVLSEDLARRRAEVSYKGVHIRCYHLDLQTPNDGSRLDRPTHL